MPLVGRDAVLDGLVPRLLGLSRERDRRVRVEFPEGGPVVEFAGGRGSGRTALLDAVDLNYNGYVPLARSDLADPRLGEADMAVLPTDWLPNASFATHVLYQLSWQLHRRVGRFTRPMEFPRLALGLTVVTVWRPGGDGPGGGDSALGPADLRSAESDLRALLTQEAPDRRRLKELLRQLSDAWLANMPVLLPGIPGMDSIVRAAVSVARDQLLAAQHGDRGAQHWWGKRLPWLAGDDVQRLFAFARDFRRPDERRRKAEQLLVAALLADIDDHYGRLQRLNKAFAPLVLLDNVHTENGRGFFELLLHAYGELPKGAKRPLVLATSLGRAAEHTPLTDVATATPWRPAHGPLLRLGIPPVTDDEIRRMLAPTDYPPHLTRLIERLSGGRVSDARILADAAVAQLRQGSGFAPVRLTALPTAAGPTTGERILLRALPGSSGGQAPEKTSEEQLRERLTLLSAALDEAGARSLCAIFHRGEEEDIDAHIAQARQLLSDTGWEERPWPGADPGTPFVRDRALRALLLHRLRETSDEERWSQVHRRLRTGHNPQELAAESTGHTTGYLHYTLALGDVEGVVRCLHDRLSPSPEAAREWLTAVNLICAAPRPPAGAAPPSPDAPDADRPTDPLCPPGPACTPCPACTDDRQRDAHAAVEALVRTVQRLSDPLLAAPDPHQVTKVDRALATLHQINGRPEPLLRAIGAWPRALTDGVQAPDLPVAEEVE